MTLVGTNISLRLYFQFLWAQTWKWAMWLGDNIIFNFLGIPMPSKNNPFIFSFTHLLPILQGPNQVSPFLGSSQFSPALPSCKLCAMQLGSRGTMPLSYPVLVPWFSCIPQVRQQILRVPIVSCSDRLTASSSEKRTWRVLGNSADGWFEGTLGGSVEP